MVYDAPHRITTLLRARKDAAVRRDFQQLVPGRCLEHGVRHFMASFGIMWEGGRMRFPRLDRARTDVEVGRLIENIGLKLKHVRVKREELGLEDKPEVEGKLEERVGSDELETEQPDKRQRVEDVRGPGGISWARK